MIKPSDIVTVVVTAVVAIGFLWYVGGFEGGSGRANCPPNVDWCAHHYDMRYVKHGPSAGI